MTDLPPAAVTEPAATPSPPTCEDLRREAEERPKSLRLLPRITGEALRITVVAPDSPARRQSPGRLIPVMAQAGLRRVAPDGWCQPFPQSSSARGS